VTYLYSVVASTALPTTSEAPGGPPGIGSLRWLALGDGLWLAAADAPLVRYGAAAVEKGLKDLDWVSACAIAHERVVEYVSRLGTAVPMKLFTLFSSDARAVAELGRSRRRLRAVLLRIEGRQEWGVRVSVDEATARTRARERAEQAAAGLSEGARFLTRKRQEHKEVRDIVDLGRGAADEVFAAVAVHADDTRRRPPSAAEPGLRLLLDAAFLVPAARASVFREAVRQEAERLAPHGYRVVLTGPWPAYNFVTGA
jgi:gas vesicle protein GvpL/GvpF